MPSTRTRNHPPCPRQRRHRCQACCLSRPVPSCPPQSPQPPTAATPAPANEPSTHSSPSHTLRHHAPRVGPPLASDAVPDRPTTRATPRSAASLPQQPPICSAPMTHRTARAQIDRPQQALSANHSLPRTSGGRRASPWRSVSHVASMLRLIASSAHSAPNVHLGAMVQQQPHS